MTNTQSHAQRELDILIKTTPDAIIKDFIPEILALCEAFGRSGQSGGSASYTASALSKAIKKLCLQQPVCPITGVDEEWNEVGTNVWQNNRCYGIFKDAGNKPYYLDAIVWNGDTVGESGNTGWDTFTGTINGISSRQFIKSFPFTPKTFYIDVTRVPYDEKIHNKAEAVSCGPGDFVYLIKDMNQLDEVFNYYNKYLQTIKEN